MKKSNEALIAHRLLWIKEKAKYARSDAQFQNGYAVGLETAVVALEEGRDFAFASIDPQPRRETVKSKA